jgi:hypothetical protein
MAVGQQGDEQAFDHGILANHGLADFIAEFLGQAGPVIIMRSEEPDEWRIVLKRWRFDSVVYDKFPWDEKFG